ncbi:MAG TPA: polysaccharide deacetylase family protein [Nitrososphaerales archaeon]|nr:polysaccharide deacetylase family protein [Nitrososphaerales archaeon]
MSLKVRRGAKSAALGLVSSRGSARPDSLSAAALRLMKIGLDPGLDSGYGGSAKAAACVSVDFDVTREERTPWNHEGTAALVRLSEKHGMPLTWAICGKTAEDDQDAYESILDSSVKQEIGVHTYSHIYADDTTEKEYEEDIEKCIRVLGISSRPTSFVFPKNREGHFGLLKRLGFKSYRGAQRVIGAPVMNAGLWNIRPVYYVDPKSLHAAGLVKKFVDACVARSAVFHLWTHPWSLSIDGRVDRMASEVMEPVFSYLEEKSNAGLLSLTTMGRLSNFMGAAA